MQEVQVPLPVGSVVRGHYLIEGLLGKGCSSAVYLVSDQRIEHTLPHRFALKEVVTPSKGERGRLIFEGASLRRLRHQAFPRIYRVFSDGNYDRVYLLMEYIEGTSLEALRQQRPEKRFSWLEAISFMAPVIDGIECLHAQQPLLLHRDIKLANIIVSEARTVLVDFGLVEEYDPKLPSAAVRSRSSAYRAPEQYNGGIDTRTDVFGLGATFYTLLTGMVPVDALSRMAQVGNGKLDPLRPVNQVIPSVPAHVAEVIDRAMSVHPHDRFSSVERFWEAIWESVNVFTVEVPSALPAHTPSVASHRSAVYGTAPAVDDSVAASMQKGPQVKRLPLFVDGRLGERWPFAQKRTGEQRATVAAPKGWRASLVWKPGIVLVLLVLLIGLGIVASFSSRVHNHAAMSLPTVIAPAPGSARAPIAVSTTYPLIAGKYNGTIDDLSSNVSTSLSLTGVQQSQGKINGYLMLGSGLQGSGPFSGSIDTAKHFQFTVTDAARHVTLFFEGAMQSATRLSGDYYQCSPNPTQNGQCSRATGSYGIWSAVLVS